MYSSRNALTFGVMLCKPRGSFSACRVGNRRTPRSCISPCRWGTGSTLRSSLSASRANIACLSSRPPDLVVAHTSVRTASLLSVPRRAAEKSEGKVVALDPRENRQFSSEHPRGRRCPPHTSTSLVLVLHDVRIIIVTPVTKLGTPRAKSVGTAMRGVPMLHQCHYVIRVRIRK